MQGSSVCAQRLRLSCSNGGEETTLHTSFSSFDIFSSSLPSSIPAVLSHVTMDKLAVVFLFLIDVVFLFPAEPSGTNLLTSTPPSFTAPSCPKPTPCAPCKNVTCATHPPPAPAPPVLAILHVKGEPGICWGMVYLIYNLSNPLPLCHESAYRAPIGGLCSQIGCGDFQGWRGTREGMGWKIQSDGSVMKDRCHALGIQCKVKPDSREMVGYKTATGLLSAVVMILVVIGLGPRMCILIRKKLIERRERQWIGPTQSQTVSFYRAQAGVQPNSNPSKRHSYPALERLAVYPSREPSSNRNSDCDSYN